VLTIGILAGGLGTRMRGRTGPDLPKVLVPVLGRPFLDYKLERLAEAGAGNVVLLVGHQGAQIRDHVRDGSRFGLAVDYVDDGPELRGTGGALLHALPTLTASGPRFWVTYGDTLLDFDISAAERRSDASGHPCLMTVLRQGSGAPEPSNCRVEGALVTAYGKRPTPPGAEHIDYGMLILGGDELLGWSDRTSFDLGEVVADLAPQGLVDAFEVGERFHDVGTLEALRDTEAYIRDLGLRD